jgi:hypothetical protein
MSYYIGVMPRMSIYLPEDLAEQLKEVDSSTPTSQVIQEALRRYLGGTGAPPWARPPEGAAELVASATQRLRAQAKADYQAGYRAALARIPDLDWALLTGFARSRYDLTAWLSGWHNGVHDAIARKDEHVVVPAFMESIAADIGSPADPIGYDRFSFRKTNAFERGYADGLRDAYESVERGTSLTNETTSGTGSGAGQPREDGDSAVTP